MEADALSRIDWEKCDETIQADSIQAIVAAAITEDVANHIESVLCSVQTIDSLFPSIADTPAISKAIPRLSGQSHPTHLEPVSSIPGALTKLDESGDPEMNLKCMTKQDWVKAQSKDKTIGEIIQLFKRKELCCRKGNETDNNAMKQFIRQQNRLFLRNGILYCKNGIQEVNHPDRNTMQLVLPEAFKKQALLGCYDDLGHLGMEWTIDLLRDGFIGPECLMMQPDI